MMRTNLPRILHRQAVRQLMSIASCSALTAERAVQELTSIVVLNTLNRYEHSHALTLLRSALRQMRSDVAI